MKLMEKLTKKAVTQVSNTVKAEVQNKAKDILPEVVGVVCTIVGLLIFCKPDSRSKTPVVINITNNYYGGRNHEH